MNLGCSIMGWFRGLNSHSGRDENVSEVDEEIKRAYERTREKGFLNLMEGDESRGINAAVDQTRATG
jgi:hypothetical protein